MAIDFPNSPPPTNGQTFTVGDTTWTYDGSKWNKNAVTISGPTGPTGPIPLVVQTGTPSTTNVLWLDSDAISSNYSISSTIVDSKGELLVGTANDTVGVVTRSTVNGDILVVDTSTTSGLRWQGQANTGRNLVINGGFDVWQRSASFTWNAQPCYGAADRWQYYHAGATLGTNVSSRQSFTAGSAPVAGYEGAYFHRITTTTLGTGQTFVDMWQAIEGVRTFANRTCTLSFWYKSSGTFSMSCSLFQNFGSGGPGQVETAFTAPSNTTTSWQRYTGTITLPSISGKTIGANNQLILVLRFLSPTAGATFDMWGVQLEAGSVATQFEELPYADTLRKCQRYFQRIGGEFLIHTESSTRAWSVIKHPEMRTSAVVTTPSLPITSGINDPYVSLRNITSIGVTTNNARSIQIEFGVSAGGMTLGRPMLYIGGDLLLSAEL